MNGSWRPTGHAVVPRYETFAAEMKRDFKKWGFDAAAGERLFIVTEEQEALEYLCKLYPKAKFYAKPRFVKFRFGANLPSQTPDNISQRENNLLYLLDIYTLSRCGYLVGGINGGVLMALNLNGNRYRGVHVMDTGVN